MDTNIEKKGNLIVTIIAAIFILYAGGYILYYDFIKEDTKNLSLKEKENRQLTAEEKKALVELVPIITNTMSYEGGYANTEKTIKDIDNIVILNMAYNELIKEKRNIIESGYEEYKLFKEQYCADATSNRCIAFYSQTLENYAKKLYGEEVKVTNESFQIGGNELDHCVFSVDTYMCTESLNLTPESIRKAGAVVLSKEDKDGVYVYEKLLFLSGYNTVLFNNTYTTNINQVFKFNNTSTLLYENITISSTKAEFDASLIDKYGEKAQLFKSTFKKDKEGNYYWVSTKPVSSTDF